MRLFPNSKKIKKKLLDEYKDKKILHLGYQKNRNKECTLGCGLKHDLTKFPWPIQDNTFDLIICQYVLEILPDTTKTLEEFNRIAKPDGKIFIEAPHYTWREAYRHPQQCHNFSFGSFDYFHKGNPYCKTDFFPLSKYLFFDDLTFLLGIGFLANLFPRAYEKKFAFMFPATSFHVTFQVQKSLI